MTLRIVLHPAAVREVQEARRYYAEVGTGLRDAFESELASVLERAQRLPNSGRAWGAAEPAAAFTRSSASRTSSSAGSTAPSCGCSPWPTSAVVPSTGSSAIADRVDVARALVRTCVLA